MAIEVGRGVRERSRGDRSMRGAEFAPRPDARAPVAVLRTSGSSIEPTNARRAERSDRHPDFSVVVDDKTPRTNGGFDLV
jgi:hypothetical protein